MTEAPAQIACLACDLLLPTPELAEGERASCPRCQHVLTSHPKDGLQRPLAFGMAALVLLAASLAFPFLSLQVGGFENVMTLPQSALELWRQGLRIVPVLVLAFILLIPGLLLGAVVALLVPLVRDRDAPWLVPTGRLIFGMQGWSMVEVFVIGVLVSLVKIGAMATVFLGISFWAYVVFAICFIATLTNLDRVQLWERIEELTA